MSAPIPYRGFIISPDFTSPNTGRTCGTQPGWRTSHPAFPKVERLPHQFRPGRELGWFASIKKAKQEIDEFIQAAQAGQLRPERRDHYCTYFPYMPRPRARGELTLEQQQAKALADAQATLWEADKAGGAEQLADHLVEWAQEQCNENASEDIDWDDEQTLEVLEAAIALIRKRLAAAVRA